MVSGCSVRNNHAEARLTDNEQFISRSERSTIEEKLRRIAQEKDLAIVVITLKCFNKQGASSAFSISRAATGVLEHLREKGSNSSLVVGLCIDTRLLSFRYDNYGAIRASYSQLTRGSKVRDLQLQALHEPVAALKGYLDLVLENYDTSWLATMGPGAEVTAYVDAQLRMEPESRVYNALITNVLSQISILAPWLVTPYSALFGTIIGALLVRWLLVNVPPMLLCLISRRLANISALFILIATELLWTLPVIGVLNIMGGGLLDNEWIMSSIAGVDLAPVYENISSISDQLVPWSWWLCFPFALIINFHSTIPFLARVQAIKELGDFGKRYIELTNVYRMERWRIDFHKELTDGALSSFYNELAESQLKWLLGWAIALTIIPPVVGLFLVCRAFSSFVEGVISYVPLAKLAEVDRHPSRYFDSSGNIVRPLPNLTKFAWGSPVGMLLGTLLFCVLLIANLALGGSKVATPNSSEPLQGVTIVPKNVHVRVPK